METNRSWSIDSRRLHFQFATEVAWEIRDGRLGRMLRDPSYAGVSPEFWGRLDAVCSAPAWRLWGIVNCGKGEPGQVMQGLARHGAGALPRRRGRGGLRASAAPGTGEPVLDVAARALAALPAGVEDAQATASRERSLLARFARSRADAGHRRSTTSR